MRCTVRYTVSHRVRRFQSLDLLVVLLFSTRACDGGEEEAKISEHGGKLGLMD